MSMLLAAAALAAALNRPAPRASLRLSRAPLVVIDPGHGGKDSGARHDGVREDQVNLAMAYTLGAILRADGYRVVLTRGLACEPVWLRRGLDPKASQALAGGRPLSSCRMNLRDRVLYAAQKRESVFLSLHCDHYADPAVHGPRTYYGEGSELQKSLAEAVQRELDAFRTRPFAPAAAKHFVLVSQPRVPAVTIELGFLTNPRERALLETESYRRDLARAIARGLDAYRREHRLVPAPKVDERAVAALWRRARARHK